MKSTKLFQDKKTRYLTLAVAGILLLAFGALWIQTQSLPKKHTENQTAAIYQDGRLLYRLSLTEDTDKPITVKSSGNGFNTIQITDGRIGIIDADCPDRLCVKMGMISSPAFPISCLPHKLVIQIEDTKEDSPVDALTQ